MLSQNRGTILLAFNYNWLIHNDLVSDFEGSNPSLTAKLQGPDGNIRAFCYPRFCGRGGQADGDGGLARV